MRWLIEAGIFTALAASLHVGALTLWDRQPPGAQSAGDGGAAHVTLQAAPDAVAAMAARWQAPPDAEAGPDPAAAPAAERPAPDMPDQRPTAQPASSPPEAPATSQGQSWRAPNASQATDAPQPPEQSQETLSPDAPDAAQQIETAQTPAAPTAPGTANQPPRADTAPPQPRIAVHQSDDRQTRPRSRSGESAHAPATESPAAPASSQASPAQTARGTGSGSDAGRRDDAEAALSDAQRSSLIAGWGAEIRARVERHKRYPSALRDSHAEGTAMVRLQVDRSGALTALGLVRSSGHAALDEAALQAVRSAARFPSAPEQLRRQSFDFELPITFRF